MNQISLFLLFLAALSAGVGQVLFKVGANGREQVIEFINMPIMCGLLLYGMGTILWIYVLSYEKLVNVYAFTVLTFVIVYMGGIFFLDEKITMAAFIGIVLIFSGLYLIVNYSS